SAGNPLGNVSVTFTAPSTGASATFPGGGSALTNSSGVATIRPTANGTIGTYNVTAAVGGATATFVLTNTRLPNLITATGGTPQTASYNSPFARSLQARVTDGDGHPLSGVPVTFTAPATGPSAIFAGSGL